MMSNFPWCGCISSCIAYVIKAHFSALADLLVIVQWYLTFLTYDLQINDSYKNLLYYLSLLM